MTSSGSKLDRRLRERLSVADRQARIWVEIVPLQNRWRGLLGELRAYGSAGVDYNVISLTTISAVLPGAVIEVVAARPDVVSVRLMESQV